MADLYNLQLDDDDLLQEQQDQEDQEQEQQQSAEEEEEEEEREQLGLPPALEAAERTRRNKRRQQQDDDGYVGTPEAADERGIDLEDVLKPSASTAASESVADGSGSGSSSMAYSRLKTLWTQELDSPELLPYDEETIQSLIDALKRQEERIDDLQTYGSGGTGASGSGDTAAELDALTVNLMRVDADRVKFVICSLLRERIRKLEEYPLYQRQFVDRMSDDEIDYLKGYGSLLESHLNRTVLTNFPQDAWKKLDSEEMIDTPDLDTYVFVRTKYDVAIDNGTPDQPDYQQHNKGSCLIVRYSRIRDLFMEDKVQLLV